MTRAPAVDTRDITGVILAGGRGARLGGVDKGLVHLRGRPLVEYVIDALRPQVGSLLISANRHREAYAAYGFPVIADATGNFDGPLAGVLSALQAAATEFVAVVPCDTPRVPDDLIRNLAAALSAAHADATAVSCEARMQPVFALLRRSLAGDLQEYLAAGERSAERWLRRQRIALAQFPDCAAFANINTPDDLRREEAAA